MMQTCPHCQTPNRPNAKFCVKCAAPLGTAPASPPETIPPPQPPLEPQTESPACPHCGTVINPKARFCARCGQPLTAEAAPSSPSPVAPAPQALSALPPQPRVTRLVSQAAPPPYSPPPYTPPKKQSGGLWRFSRGQRIILTGLAGAVVVTLAALAGFIVTPMVAVKPATAPTLTVTLTIVTSPTTSPHPTARHTSTPIPSPAAEEWETVQPEEGLYEVCRRHCPSLSKDYEALVKYARTVAEMNNVPWVGGVEPMLLAKQKLRMAPCP